MTKVEFHVGVAVSPLSFIVTNEELPTRTVVRVGNMRGAAEQWINDGNLVVNSIRHSCHWFQRNEVRLWLSVIANILGNLWRRLVMLKKIGNWSLTSLKQRLVKFGEWLVKHARYYRLLLTEGHLTRQGFGSMLRRISALPFRTNSEQERQRIEH